jgi:hypothetical protein
MYTKKSTQKGKIVAKNTKNTIFSLTRPDHGTIMMKQYYELYMYILQDVFPLQFARQDMKNSYPPPPPYTTRRDVLENKLRLPKPGFFRSRRGNGGLNALLFVPVV